MSPRTRAARRLGNIRLALILLALVPSLTLAGMWALTTNHMFSEGMELRAHTELSRSTGGMGTHATLALQQERRLTAAWLAERGGDRTALEDQRKKTDAAVAQLVGRTDAIAEAPERISERLSGVLDSVSGLEYYRSQVDNPTHITAEQALDQYAAINSDQIQAFRELSQLDNGDLTSQAEPLVALEHAAELVSREDALLTMAWPSGRLSTQAWTDFADLVHSRRWLIRDQVMPSLRGEIRTKVQQILESADWRAMESIEDEVIGTPHRHSMHSVELPDVQDRWDEAMDHITAQYDTMLRGETDALLDRSADEARSLLLRAASISAAGLLALVLCVALSWRITRSLLRRLHGLRVATLKLAEERLPDVLTRLKQGETVDAESATQPLDYGYDELGLVAQAFNTAQRTAVHTAVELADTRRGFQKVILGIARQSQNLVNLQLSKLDALERRHTDPEVLKDLYELDSTASQLRRYEENLVVVSGERPGRSWSSPVALIDIVRSAVGEVAEYQRVEVLTEEEVSLAPPAVADVIHLLAELIDNATAYSAAPSPVGVRATMVPNGLVVEVEDRGLGMSDEDYALLNAQLTKPPQFDVVALADDLRLGMFVIAQLAQRHGIVVTLRPSPYGGTTAIVLVPHDIVVRDVPSDNEPQDSVGHARAEMPARGPAGGKRANSNAKGTPAATETATKPETRTPTSRPSPPARTAPAPAAPRRDGLLPLPRRVPQTSLAAELREESPLRTEKDSGAQDFTAERAASSLAGFQHGTSRARTVDDIDVSDDTGDAAPPDAAGEPVQVSPEPPMPTADRRPPIAHEGTPS